MCEAQLQEKTTKEGVAGEPSKMCKCCAESKKLAAQRKQLASHLEEEDRTVYDNLASFPSLARGRNALNDEVANGICMLRLPILTRQMAGIIAEYFGNATSCHWK